MFTVYGQYYFVTWQELMELIKYNQLTPSLEVRYRFRNSRNVNTSLGGFIKKVTFSGIIEIKRVGHAEPSSYIHGIPCKKLFIVHNIVGSHVEKYVSVVYFFVWPTNNTYVQTMRNIQNKEHVGLSCRRKRRKKSRDKSTETRVHLTYLNG